MLVEVASAHNWLTLSGSTLVLTNLESKRRNLISDWDTIRDLEISLGTSGSGSLIKYGLASSTSVPLASMDTISFRGRFIGLANGRGITGSNKPDVYNEIPYPAVWIQPEPIAPLDPSLRRNPYPPNYRRFNQLVDGNTFAGSEGVMDSCR
ncbi:hypothetical protein PCANC_22760 [Puccinia coronata f. sp. avenae]|uniref:Uncharacterized protein n=1 Tax=Puccinia coronata f. sp. avenae TaxID=200324 RepID=A0A2N5S9Y6_9BASI|nr:hypothetical protein PCANC_22760 [Puccinia coronata f. sp. avenae]